MLMNFDKVNRARLFITFDTRSIIASVISLTCPLQVEQQRGKAEASDLFQGRPQQHIGRSHLDRSPRTLYPTQNFPLVLNRLLTHVTAL